MKILNFSSKILILRNFIHLIILIILAISCKKDEVATDQDNFIKSYGIGPKSEGADLIQLKDGSYIIYGTCTTDSFGTDLFITKVNKYGNEIWKRNFGSKKDETAYVMHPLTSGGYLLLGTVNTSVLLNENSTNIFLAKTNPEGNSLIWEKRFYSSQSTIGYDLQELSTGGYVIAGTIKNNEGLYSILYYTNNEGVVIDSLYKAYKDIEVKKIINVKDSFQLIGTCNSGVFGVLGESDMYAFNVLTNGRVFSSNRIGESEADKAIDIKLLADGSFIYLGNEADKNIRLVKFKMNKENFVPLWKEKSKKLTGSADSTFQPSCIEIISEKEYVISGTVNNKEIFVIKTDSSGNETYKHVFKSSIVKKCNKIITTNDGNMAVLGTNEYSGYKVISLLKVNCK